MSWVTVVWSAAGAACATLAVLHLIVWCRQPRSYAYLLFAICALSVAGIALFELRMMYSKDVVECGLAQRWAHLPLFTMIFSLVAFVYVHFGAGLLWLGAMAVGARFISLVLNFTQPVNLNYEEITSLGHVIYPGGEVIAYPIGIANPLVIIGQVSSLLAFAFVADASIRCWRAGRCRQRGLWLGGSICLFILLAAVHAALVNTGKIQSPYLITFPFLGTALAMGFELSSGILHAARLGARLQISQAELHQIEQRLGVATDAAKLGIFTWDVQNDRLWMNEYCAAMLGWRPGEQNSIEELYRLIRNADRERIREAVKRAVETTGEYECEFGIGQSHNTQRWIAARGRIEKSSEGTPAHLHGVCTDITQRHHSEERFRVVFESAPSALIIADSNGTMILANGETERVFQFPRRELQGQPLKQLLPDSKLTDWQIGSADEDKNLRPAAGAIREVRGQRKDGTSVSLEMGLTPIRTSVGSLVLASIVDVTDRNEAKRVAAQQHSEIAHLSRITMLGEVSGSIAHELNQPLSAILTNAETAQRFLAHSPPNYSELNDILDEIVDDVSRAAEVIRLLRVLQKKSEADFRELDTHTVIADVVRILHMEAGIRNVTIKLSFSDDLPTVRGDKVQLEQVIINLLLNAFDAMSETDPEQRMVTIATSIDDNEMVQVAVTDAGSGLDTGTMQRMFEPFYTSKVTGLGLGLSICKSIIETHRGRLGAYNNDAHGATIHFTLPCFSPATQPRATVAV